MDDLIGTRAAGRLLSVSQGYIKVLIRKGKIAGHKQEGVWFLSRLSVLEYKEWQEKRDEPPKPLMTRAAEVVDSETDSRD